MLTLEARVKRFPSFDVRIFPVLLRVRICIGYVGGISGSYGGLCDRGLDWLYGG